MKRGLVIGQREEECEIFGDKLRSERERKTKVRM